MKSYEKITKILFIDDDEVSFQFRKCMSQVLKTLPRVELFHANDATEGLSMLEDISPDAIVLDDEMPEECSLFLESLSPLHPPVIIQTEKDEKVSTNFSNSELTYIEKNESLDGVHSTLMKVTTIADSRNGYTESKIH